MSKATATQRKREQRFIQSVFDRNASFSTEYYFEMLRIAGTNPRLERLAAGRRVHWARDVNCEDSSEKLALTFAVENWASDSDPHFTERYKYLRNVVIPPGDEIFEVLLG